jgi:hypothetical protein
MPNFLKSILRAPAGDGSEGGGAGTDNDIYGAGVDDETDDETPETPEGNEPPVPSEKPKAAETATPPVTAAPAAAPTATAPTTPPVAPAAIDPKAIEDAIRKFVPQPSAPAAPAAQKALKDKEWEELTDEEFNIRSHRVLVNPQMLHDIGITDATPEQVGKFQTLVDGIATHAIELSTAEFQRALKAAESRFAPMLGDYQKYQAQETENKFYGEHKDLAEMRKSIPKFDDLVVITAKSINPKHPNGANKTYEDVSTELATNLRSIFKSIAPNGFTPSPATQPAPAAPVVPVPTPATMGTPGRSSRATQGNPTVTAGQDNGASIY